MPGSCTFLYEAKKIDKLYAKLMTYQRLVFPFSDMEMQHPSHMAGEDRAIGLA